MNPDTGAAAYLISGGMAGGWVILGLTAILLLSHGIPLILAGLILGAPAWLALIGALLVGLAIGLVLSQVFSDDAKAEIKQIFDHILKGILPILSALGLTLAWWVAVIALIISKIIDIYKESAIYYYRNRRYIYTQNVKKVFLRT